MTTVLPASDPESVSDWSKLKTAVILAVVALFVSSPFLTTHGLGTGEAYNYSLSVADFVTQTRSGVMPVLVGQSDYAFNGRIHPVRTAPYILYAAAALDTLTFHRLNFWTLQNLVVAGSLILGIASMFVCLRRTTGLHRNHAAILASFYALSPGVLAPTYAMDLYMTVMTVPWIPIVLASVARSYRNRSFSTFGIMSVSLAACWAAHPPVAMWLTIAVVLAELPVLFGGKIRLKELGSIGFSAVIGAALTCFVFASALSVESYGTITHAENVDLLLREIRRVFWDTLRPIGNGVGSLGDFQLGYGGFFVLGGAIVWGLAKRRGAALVFCALAALLLLLLLPINGLVDHLWIAMPAVITNLTNQWPMQRFYLLITALSIFALGLGAPFSFTGKKGLVSDGLRLVLIALGIWTFFQGSKFILQGFRGRQDASLSLKRHLPENIDPTVTSFAFVGAPPWFVNGAMDPRMEGRLLSPFDGKPVLSNWNSPPLTGKSVTGTFRGSPEGADTLALNPTLTLEPGTKYLLDFKFTNIPQKLALQLRGARFYREYLLPEAGNPSGFGMLPANRHALTLWTSGHGPDRVQLKLLASGIGTQPNSRFADFSFTALDAHKLPIEITDLIPMEANIRSPSPGYFEAPRAFIKGYRALVNGTEVHVQSSPDRLLLVPVPQGESHVKIYYYGSSLLRVTFWISMVSWIIVAGTAAVLIAQHFFPIRDFGQNLSTWGTRVTVGARDFRQRFFDKKWYIVASLVALSVAAWGWTARQNYLQAVGPIHLRVIFDRYHVTRVQPLLVTGKPYAGDFIFVRLVDDKHVVFGTDVWSRNGDVSAPVEIDYFAEHDVVITNGALYPEGHPALKSLTSAELSKLRSTVRVELDGKVVLQVAAVSFPTKLSQLTVGENKIGGSNAGLLFTGEIIHADRLPVARGLAP